VQQSSKKELSLGKLLHLKYATAPNLTVLQPSGLGYVVPIVMHAQQDQFHHMLLYPSDPSGATQLLKNSVNTSYLILVMHNNSKDSVIVSNCIVVMQKNSKRAVSPHASVS
jgi:hypothetical protein